MKKLFKKTQLVSGMLLLTAAGLNAAHAHDFSGAFSLSGGGNGAGATDVWTMTCFQDPGSPSQSPTAKIFLQVRDDNTAGGQISATAILNSAISSQVTSNTKTAVTVTDLIPADGIAGTARYLTLPTPAQDVNVTVLVHHTAQASDSYLLSFHCLDAANSHTGTDDIPVLLQNQ